jgi:hypothetical protein
LLLAEADGVGEDVDAADTRIEEIFTFSFGAPSPLLALAPVTPFFAIA